MIKNRRSKLLACFLVLVVFAGAGGLVASDSHALPTDGSAPVAMEEHGKDPVAVAKDLLEKGGAENKKSAAKILRGVIIEAINSKEELPVMPAGLLLAEIKQGIRAAHLEITDEEYDKAQKSVGRALLEKYGFEKAIDVLIEEAECLSAPAQIMLEVLYKYKVDGCPAYDKRILKFFEQTAEEGLPRSQFFLGHVYVSGWGVPEDVRKGQKYLDLSNWHERGFDLPGEDQLPVIRPGVNSEAVEV